MKIFTEINEIKFSNNEEIILKFINKTPDLFIESTIQELSKKLFVSIGSISRLAKKMNFDSFRDMKNFVIKEQLRSETYYKLKKSDTTSSIIHNVKVYNRHTIEKTIDSLLPESIKKSVSLIEKSSKIVTYGLGSSSLAANEIANNLNINGINAVFATTIHDIIVWLKKKIEKNILIVIFSKGMLNKENIFIVNLLNKYKIKVILVTENTKYKSKEDLIVLNFKTLEGSNNKIQISSKISQLFISDILMQNIFKQTEIKNTDLYKEFHDKWRDA